MATSNYRKFITYFVMVIPLLAPYKGFGIILLPELILIALFPLNLYSFVGSRYKIDGIYKNLILYLSIMVLSAFAVLYNPQFSLAEYTKALIRIMFYVINIILLDDLFIPELFIGAYLGFATLLSIYLIVQYFVFNIFSITLPWFFSFLPMQQENYATTNFKIWFDYLYRPSSFFIEPAHFSQYSLPALLYLLFYRKKENVYGIFIIACAIFLSTSGTGIVILIAFLLMKFLKGDSKNKLLISVGVIGLLVVMASYNSLALLKIVVRLSPFNPLSSTGIRIFRGFFVFSELPLVNKLFGIGYGNYGTYVTRNGITTIFDLDKNNVWVNAAMYNLTGVGIVGFFMQMNLLFRIKNAMTGFSRGRMLLLIVTMLFSDEMTTISIILVFLLMKNYRDKDVLFDEYSICH